MIAEFEVSRTQGRCAVSGRTFGPGEVFYTALYETAAGFERRDYAAEHWSAAPAGAFCTYRTRVAERPAKRRLDLNDEALLIFFERLAEETDPIKVSFRFVLALILMRKRVLRYEQTLRDSEEERWLLRVVKTGRLVPVRNPRMTETEVAAVTEQLKSVLADFDEGDVAADSSLPADAAAPPGAERSHSVPA